jgi:hypothetical protein
MAGLKGGRSDRGSPCQAAATTIGQRHDFGPKAVGVDAAAVASEKILFYPKLVVLLVFDKRPYVLPPDILQLADGMLFEKDQKAADRFCRRSDRCRFAVAPILILQIVDHILQALAK